MVHFLGGTSTSPYYGTFSFQNPVDSTVWQAGNSYAIQWQYTGSLGTYVTLQLYNDSTYYSSISTLATLSTGSYTWTIPGAIASGSNYRIKIASYSDPGRYSFSEKFTIAGLNPDAFENDNSRDSAKTAVSGVLQLHSLTYGDTDWVRIAMDSGKTYIIQDSGVSAFYTQLYLYYGTATSYTSYNYSTSTMTWQYACTQTGTYYLKIYPYYSGYTGSYNLRVREFDPYTSVAFGNPTSATTWATGSSYTINWTPDVGLLSSWVNLYLYKGNQLISSIYYDLSNSGSYTWTIPSGIATGSDYRIRVANYSYPTTIYGYSQNFTISGVNPDAYEFDNTRDSAKTASSGVSQVHTMTFGDTDWVRFTADSGSTYVLRVNTGAYVTYPTCVYFYLYYNTETSYTYYNYSYSSGVMTYVWPCTKSGTWYVKMYQYSTTYLGEYSFRETKIDSTSATFVNPTAASVWSANTAYTVNWSADTALFSNSLYLYLYKGSKYITSIASGTANDGSQAWTVPAGLATGSDYRIWLANYSNSSIAVYSPAFTISGIAPDAYENDDSASVAKPITTDGTPQGRTLSLGDYDWISFTAEKDSMYVIQGSGGSTVYLYLYLYSNPAGTYLNYVYGYTPKLVWTCPANGTYYLRLYPSGSYGSYSVSVRKYSVMSSVVFANPSAGAAWSTGSTYTINWSADTALFSPYVNLQLAVDTTVLSTIVTYRVNTQGGSTFSWAPPAGLATGSRYRIKVINYSYSTIIGFSDTFTISGIAPDAYEPDNSSAAAHVIATNGVPEGHTITLGDKDWYRFTAAANLLYMLQGHGSIRPAMYLYNTDGATLLTSANTGSTDTVATIVWMCPASGTYYFRDTATGSYGYGSYQTSASVYDSAAYSLTVTAPAANDSLTTGQIYNIQWSSAVSIGGNVDIFLYNSGGIVGTVIANVANSGSYSWTVSGTITPGDTYYVRVISRVYPNISGNSGVFKIGVP